MKKEAEYQAVKDYVDHPGKNKSRIAQTFAVTSRTVNRWINGYKKHGKTFFVHGNTTLEPDCRIADEIRAKVVELYQSETYRGCNFALFTEMLRKYEDIHISEQSTRNILHAAGIHPSIITTSETKIEFCVASALADTAVRTVEKEFTLG